LKENLALKKPTYQLHRYVGLPESLTGASNAVDGLRTNLSVWSGQCAISENRKQTATWWVNLTSILSIHHVTIYYRTGNVPWGPKNGFTPRFLGFSLYVSNTTDISKGILCYRDTGYRLDTIPAVFNTTCPVHGQYISYHNERLSGVVYPGGYSEYAFNELCEVEVFGCPSTGYYGSSCAIPCPDPNCRYCHIETGACQGCKPGYQGHRCETECNDGFYGQDCSFKCTSTCASCNNVNGVCDSGCLPGWKGIDCRKPCENGTFGIDCNQTCGKCLEKSVCNPVNGTCGRGCDAGYIGDLCKTHCNQGTHGLGCKQTCGNCMNNESCFHINGSCLTGCDPGYEGEKCNMVCHKGMYGLGCRDSCGHCSNQSSCFFENGTCLKGCDPGFVGALCKIPCLNGTYGKECNNTCGHCFRQEHCLHTNGTCLSGCDTGFVGKECKTGSI
ncbi:uncharacterized protein LOC144623538, partial [Crassostrea virginica]